MRTKLIIMTFILLSACSKPIVINNLSDTVEKISMFGKNSNRSFYFNESISKDLKYEWNNDSHGSFSSTTFLAYDSLIIVPDLGGRISTFHVDTGKKIGELKYKGEVAQAPILVNSKLVFIVNNLRESESTLIFYNIVKGEEIRNVELSGKFGIELLAANEMIFIISEFGKIYKYSLSGKLEWEKELKTKILTDPAADKNNLFIASVDGSLMKLSQKNGNLLLSKDISRGFQSGISLDGGNLYVGDDDGKCMSINKNSFDINWEYETNTKIVQTPVADEKYVYIGNLSGKLVSINKTSGNLEWEINVDGLFNVAPLVFSNIIVQPNLLKKIHFINKDDGEIINELEFDLRVRTSPLFHKDRLFFGIDKGEVYCYSLN